MISPSLQGLLRRGGVLHGPRLIVAILAVFILIFYFSAPNPKSRATDLSRRPTHATDPSRGGKDIIQEYTEQYEKEHESDSLSDKFFEYLGHHKSPSEPTTTTTTSSVPIASPTSGASILDIPDDPICDKLAKAAQDVLVIVNAAAPDLYTQLPSQLLSHLRCAPVSIFSTVSMTLGSHVVHDAIASVSSETQSKYHTVFELYKKQRTAQQLFQNLADITAGTKELEKWTIIPALIESYKMHPEKKFFILITPTTYLSIPNLLAWLPSLSANVPLYIGAEVIHDSIESASANTGILLSRAAVAALSKMYGQRKDKWEDSTNSRVSVDTVLGEALKESGVLLSRAFPHFQGNSILSIDWSQSVWCKAPVAWGGMTPSLMNMVWDFERNWTTKHASALVPEPVPTSTSTTTRGWFGKRTPETSTTPDVAAATGTPTSLSSPRPIGPTFPPYHYSTLLTTILSPLIAAYPNRSSWDNGANTFIYTDTTRTSSFAHNSVDTCRAACDIRAKCVQYVWEPNKCSLGTHVRLGGPSEGKMSGWITSRVSKFAVAQTCDAAKNPGSFVEVVDPKLQPASITGPASADGLPSESDELDLDEPENEELGQKQEPPAEQEKEKFEESETVDEQPTTNEKVEILQDTTVTSDDELPPPPTDELV
jgi:hypothetical protein